MKWHSILYIGFLLKCFTVLSSIPVHADNSIFRETDNCFSFLSRFIDPFLTQHGPILVGEASCSLAKVVRHQHCGGERRKEIEHYRRVIQWTNHFYIKHQDLCSLATSLLKRLSKECLRTHAFIQFCPNQRNMVASLRKLTHSIHTTAC